MLIQIRPPAYKALVPEVGVTSNMSLEEAPVGRAYCVSKFKRAQKMYSYGITNSILADCAAVAVAWALLDPYSTLI